MFHLISILMLFYQEWYRPAWYLKCGIKRLLMSSLVKAVFLVLKLFQKGEDERRSAKYLTWKSTFHKAERKPLHRKSYFCFSPLRKIKTKNRSFMTSSNPAQVIFSYQAIVLIIHKLKKMKEDCNIDYVNKLCKKCSITFSKIVAFSEFSNFKYNNSF